MPEVESAELALFRKAGQLPLTWQWSAREFVAAANIQWRRHQETVRAKLPGAPSSCLLNLVAPTMLMYGLALENMIKGLLIARGIDGTSTGKLNPRLKIHNLRKLGTDAGLPVSEGVNELLDKLRWSVETGRYPVGIEPTPRDADAAWIGLINVADILAAVEVVEQALREDATRSLEKTDLAKLGGMSQ